MKYYLYDILYNKIPLAENDLKLFQTKEMVRLRQVSMASIPAWVLRSSIAPTRFEHSVGTAYLAKKLGQKKNFADISSNLYYAALAHDLATPPMSHIADDFQHELFGAKHDRLLNKIIFDSEFGKEVKKQGGDLEIIAKLISGEYVPLSDLINGTIDLDNMDNTQRYGLSVGVFQRKMYSPVKIASGFSFDGGKLSLRISKKELISWENCRKKVYKFVFDSEDSTPMYRAFYFAAINGELRPEFFLLTDHEAVDYLKKCNKTTQKLIQKAEKWVVDKKIYEIHLHGLSDKAKYYFANHALESGKLSDLVADKIKLPREDVNVALIRNKGFKQIHLNLIDEDGKEYRHEPKQTMSWTVQVFIAPWQAAKKEAVAEIVNGIFKNG